MKYIFSIKGIDCGNCAAKIESKLKQEVLFTSVTMKFMLEKLEVETAKAEDAERIRKHVEKIVNKIESDVKVELIKIQEGVKQQAVDTASCSTHDHKACGCGEAHEENKHTECGCGEEHEEHEHTGCGCGEDHEEREYTGCGCVGKHEGHEHTECGCDVDNNAEKHVGCGCAEHNKKSAIKKSGMFNLSSKDYKIWGRILGSVGLLIAGVLTSWNVLIGLAYLLIGYDVLLKATKNIFKGKVFDEHFLMTIATIAAFVIGEYPEAVAVMLFYQVGEYFQARAVNQSRKAVESLMSIKPEFARVKRDNQWITVMPEEVNVGEILQVRPGEKIPLDSTIIQGETTLDMSMLTGESLPVYREVGQELLSGSINIERMIEIKVTQLLQDSTVSKVLELIENASSRKTKAENFITKFAAVYTPMVVIMAVLIAIIPSLLTGNWYHWIYTSIVFLVISCPCALVVSIPLSFFGGIGAASREGILVKGSNYLEMLSTVDVVVMDKTGTITKGNFEVTEVICAEGVEKAELIRYAALLEQHSNHPIATAIVKAVGEVVSYKLKDTEVSMYTEKAGFGLLGNVEGKTLKVGNDKLMELENISYKQVNKVGTIIHVAVGTEYKGCIIVADAIKEDSKEAVKALKARGIKRIIMLTGDQEEVAQAVGKEVGIDEVYAGLLPQNKVEKVDNLVKEGYKVAFVGDGINDAPVLALAHVGVAMGGIGSDAAVEASDMVIMTDALSQLPKAIDIAKKTKAIVVQNITLALGVKLLVMILGIVGIANMWLAVFADVGVSIIAILNALRILKKQRPKKTSR